MLREATDLDLLAVASLAGLGLMELDVQRLAKRESEDTNV